MATTPRASQALSRASTASFVLGAATWAFTAYPLNIGDAAGVTDWNPYAWTVPLLPLALVLLGVALARVSRARRAVAAAIVVALAALLWLWPWGAGFYDPAAWGDRAVGALAYPALVAAWLVLSGVRGRGYAALSIMALVVAAATVMWPGPTGSIPWATAWRSNAWMLGPVIVHVSGAGIAAATASFGAVSLADRWSPQRGAATARKAADAS